MAKFEYSKWRHGGWYVHNVRYPSGACGCVSNNYDDRKWRIACDPRPFDQRPTFSSRDDAAGAEASLVYGMKNPQSSMEDAAAGPMGRHLEIVKALFEIALLDKARTEGEIAPDGEGYDEVMSIALDTWKQVPAAERYAVLAVYAKGENEAFRAKLETLFAE